MRSTNTSLKSISGTAIALAAGLLFSGPSHADTFTFALTSDHCDNPGGCIEIDGASAGTITITDVSTGVVSVNVTLNSGFEFVHTGFDTDIGFNLVGILR